MMRRTTYFGMAFCAFCLLLSSQAVTLAADKPAAPQQSEVCFPGPQRSSHVVGMSVQNPKGEDLGKIDELIISPEGTITYAILSHGGLLGIGDKLVPIPWRALRAGKKEKTLIVNIDKATLEKAPNFEPKEWPNFAEPEWQKKVQIYYELPEAKGKKDKAMSQ
jgi:sporulation protein YlmC with PRC-barrel domain